MKLIYLTAKKYPGSTADHNYILNLARAFFKEFGQNFSFVACNTNLQDLHDIPLVNVLIPNLLKRTFVFFFWIPWYWFNNIHKDLDTGKRVIFFSNDLNLLSILIFWKRLLNLPIIIVADWHYWSGSWKDIFVFKNSNYSVVTSDKLKRAISHVSPLSNIQTIYGGVSLEQYEAVDNLKQVRLQLGLPLHKFLIGYIGLFRSLGIDKGISMMIDSLEYLDPDNIMVFVGGKNNEIDNYKKYAETKQLTDRCIFIPLQIFEKVVLYEKVMDILVIPYPDHPHFRDIGFPMKIYEYMAANVPIVYTQLGLVEEIVADCAYGIKPDNPLELAKIISFIKLNPDDVKKKKLLAFEKVKKLSWADKAKSIIAVFK